MLDMSLFKSKPESEIKKNAFKYWSGEHSDNPTYEILAKLPVKVLRKLTIDECNDLLNKL